MKSISKFIVLCLITLLSFTLTACSKPHENEIRYKSTLLAKQQLKLTSKPDIKWISYDTFGDDNFCKIVFTAKGSNGKSYRFTNYYNLKNLKLINTIAVSKDFLDHLVLTNLPTFEKDVATYKAMQYKYNVIDQALTAYDSVPDNEEDEARINELIEDYEDIYDSLPDRIRLYLKEPPDKF